MTRDLFGQDSRSDGARRSDLVDLKLHLHWDRPLSLLVSRDGDPAKAVFLPKEAIEFERKGASAVVKVTLPERLAIDKGLV